MVKLILFAIAIYFLSCTNSSRNPVGNNFSQDTSLKIIMTGIPDLEVNTQLNSLARKYGFKYYSIGCVASKHLWDSIQGVNNITYKILKERFGKNWRLNLYSEFDTTYQIRQQADSVIQSRFSHKEEYFYYLVKRSSDRKHYIVKVYGVDLLNGNSEPVVYYNIVITTGKEPKFDISVVSQFEMILK